MKDKLSDEQTDDILKAIDEALEEGPWDESNFLRVIGKNLREIRDDFEKLVHHAQQSKSKLNDRFTQRAVMRSEQVEIFVSLYSSTGSNLSSWERIISNLPRQITSRAVYKDEADVQAMIRTRENRVNEAYVSIYINQSDILPSAGDKTPKDRLGKPLLTLKDKSILLENVNLFVHQSGKYRFYQGRLIKIPAGESE